jgi:hypothetical protein
MEKITEEVWKLIDGYPNYQISNLGRVKSLNYLNTGRISILKQCASSRYFQVRLFLNNVRKMKSIHRLVAIHFVPNQENKSTVNHKDGDKLNNHASNLEWCTQKENNKHAWDSGLKKHSDYNKKVTSELFSKKVINKRTGEIYPSLTEAQKHSEYSMSHLSAMLKGKHLNKTYFEYL